MCPTTRRGRSTTSDRSKSSIRTWRTSSTNPPRGAPRSCAASDPASPDDPSHGTHAPGALVRGGTCAARARGRSRHDRRPASLDDSRATDQPSLRARVDAPAAREQEPHPRDDRAAGIEGAPRHDEGRARCAGHRCRRVGDAREAGRKSPVAHALYRRRRRRGVGGGDRNAGLGDHMLSLLVTVATAATAGVAHYWMAHNERGIEFWRWLIDVGRYNWYAHIDPRLAAIGDAFQELRRVGVLAYLRGGRRRDRKPRKPRRS